MRDDFSAPVRRVLAERVAYRCSRPGCRAPTVAAALAPRQTASVGVAAHISAAAPGGPRFDASLLPEERSSANNGIWLCQTDSRLVDVDPARYSTDVLRSWKAAAEEAAASEIGRPVEFGGRGLDVRERRDQRTWLRLAIYRRLSQSNLTGGSRMRHLVRDLDRQYEEADIWSEVVHLREEDLLHWHEPISVLTPATRLYLGGQRNINQAMLRWHAFEHSLEEATLLSCDRCRRATPLPNASSS